MKLKIAVFILITALCTVGQGQDKKEIPQADQVKILKALRAFDEIEQKKNQLVIQFNQLNQQMLDLKSQYQALDQPSKDAQKKIDDSIAEAAKELNLDMTKYNFDKKELTFTLKPPPGTVPPPVPPAPVAPAAPAGDKK
jgi:chromosome segregation ATPase